MCVRACVCLCVPVCVCVRVHVCACPAIKAHEETNVPGHVEHLATCITNAPSFFSSSGRTWLRSRGREASWTCSGTLPSGSGCSSSTSTGNVSPVRETTAAAVSYGTKRLRVISSQHARPTHTRTPHSHRHASITLTSQSHTHLTPTVAHLTPTHAYLTPKHAHVTTHTHARCFGFSVSLIYFALSLNAGTHTSLPHTHTSHAHMHTSHPHTHTVSGSP